MYLLQNCRYKNWSKFKNADNRKAQLTQAMQNLQEAQLICDSRSYCTQKHDRLKTHYCVISVITLFIA